MTPALIFDLDGTLVDTAPDLLGALNAVLVDAGQPPVALADMRHLVGFGARALIANALERTGAAGEPQQIDAMKEAFLAYYRGHIAELTRPYPGVEETLAGLKADGARMGVLTNKPHDLTLLLMGKLGLDKYFAAVFGQGRMPYTKPDARIFRDVVEAVGGAGALMIGDSITDVLTARAGGAPVVLVSYGYTPEPARTLGADAVVDRFSDVPEAARRLLAGREANRAQK